MPFYGRDFLEDERVAAFGPAAKFVYIALLWRQWCHGHVPADPSLAAKLIGEPGEFDSVQAILEEFFDPVEGAGGKRLANARCSALLAKAAERSAKARASAGLSASVRSAKAKRSLSEGSALRGEERREEERTRSPSSTKGHRGKRDVLFQEAEEKPAQPPKPPRARSAAEKLWLEAWKATRGEDYALLRADCIVLNKLGDQFGPDALGMKIHSLLSDTDKFVATNASPRLLESRWNQVGSLPMPGRKLAPPGRAEKLKAILDAGEPKRGTEAWCVWDSARQELASIRVGGAA